MIDRICQRIGQEKKSKDRKPPKKEEEAEEMHFYFSSYYKWIPEKRKQQQKKLLWLWIRWKMQFCFGRCCSTVIHQKGTFVGKSSSLLSLIFSFLWLLCTVSENYQKKSPWNVPLVLSYKNVQICQICEIWKWSKLRCARGCVSYCDYW